MLYYPEFYRKYGIRRVAQLVSPTMPMLERLELPRHAIYHYVGDGLLDDGPTPDEFLFRNITRPILLGNVVAIGDNKGLPRRLSVPVEPLIRAYHAKNRRYRKLVDFSNIGRDDLAPVVFSYAFIPRLYRYMRSIYSDYNRWYNTQAAVWKNIGRLTDESDRHQFIQFKLPKILPSISNLRTASGVFNQKMAKIFDSSESLVLLEIWKWLGEDRDHSILNHLPLKGLDRVSLIFTESNRWIVLNLGILNSWRIAAKKELEANPDLNTKGFQAEQLQKRFLRLIVSIFEARTSNPPENLEESPIAPVVTTVITPAPAGQVAIPIDSAQVTLPTQTTQVLTPTEAADATNAHHKDIDSGSDIEDDFEVDIRIDEELAELERMAIVSALEPALVDTLDDDDEMDVQPDLEPGKNEDEGPSTLGTEAKTLESAMMQVCDRYADNGLMSAAEYKRYSELSVSYKNIISPDGSTTLDKFIKIPAEDLKIDKNQTIIDIPTVFDKSMLKSSLQTFDEHYIKNVLQKDVSGMIMNVQRAGIAITDYEVERVEDILGDYDDYTVRITPIDGSSSTLKFRLPAINDDGTFTANGTKYRSRKQRGDLPIRKISPIRVALTSYYGKTFVSRSTKKVNDYGNWICNTIMDLALNPEDARITEIFRADVFDNTFMAPRLYSTLAMQFRGMTINPPYLPKALGTLSYVISLEHTKRESLYGTEALALYEKEGSIILGWNEVDNYLVLGKDNALYNGNAGNLTALGTIENVLGLDSSRIPVEFAELKVLGRTIPVGIILGYEMGLDKLLTLLKVSPRRVPVGTRVNLDPEEYSIVFNDETLVFSKDNQYASMILAGFNEYHRSVRQYNVHEFDARGVYLNILEENGTSSRYLREIDLLYQLFVDPITRELLIEMKEPVNFRGLLLRSCELLQYDQHPDELDSAYMRVKGYERMAGAVYSEITKSIRVHASKPGKSKLPIDLHPWVIWTNIANDPAKIQIADINPIENLKQMEAMTYSGVGGRSSRSMTKSTRAYHPNDMGTVSESTVDSSDVAINTYTSADPQFTSVRGISKRYQIGKTGHTALFSTSALVSPASDRDDPKRVN